MRKGLNLLFLLYFLHSYHLNAGQAFPLHDAIANHQGTSSIEKLAAQGLNPNELSSLGQNAWQLIAGLPQSGCAKKNLRYAINRGLRDYFMKNDAKVHLGDCGDVNCDVAKIALGLSVPARASNRKQTLCEVYNKLNERLKAHTCRALGRHKLEGTTLRQALISGYCNRSYTSSSKNIDKNRRIKITEIQRFRRDLRELLMAYPYSAGEPKIKEEPRKKRKKSAPCENITARKVLSNLPQVDDFKEADLDNISDQAEDYPVSSPRAYKPAEQELYEEDPLDLDSFFANKLEGYQRD